VYEDRFLAVPRRQIGISGSSNDKALLKALALYLNSDFALYFQFFHSSEAGIQKTIYAPKDLRALPVPLSFMDGENFGEWLELFKAIETALGKDRDDFDTPDLLRRLNDLTSRALKLDSRAQCLIDDLVNIRMSMTRGKITSTVIAKSTEAEIQTYLRAFQTELDQFFEGSTGRHSVLARLSEDMAAIEVRLIQTATAAQPIRIAREGAELSKEYENAREQLFQEHSQWFYFARNLRIYSGQYTYMFKPLRRLHWTRTQAMLDAAELVGDMIAAGSLRRATLKT
jgi:hypothetical protein